MATNHTAQIAIKHGVESQGFFSYENPKILLLFVHGFGGNALTTWNKFPSLLLVEDQFKNADIIFYGYDTFKGQAGEHAAELYHFINAAMTPLQSKILPPGQGLPERIYDRIIMVAHSLGAVLVRQAQLLAHIANKPWVAKSEIALFAPAHHGANVIPLATQALTGIGGLLGIFAKFQFPILSDLAADDDGILKAIKAQTEALQNQGKGEFTKAKLVVYAKGDKVVRDYQYLLDAPPVVVQDTNHIAICKPTDAMHQSIAYLKSVI
jgi:pimeloyl-ACP methyl ester carboxylesterase